MAHHQQHGADHDALLSRSVLTRSTPSNPTSMPAISEDELLADGDEPPDPNPFTSAFTKYTFPAPVRRQSLLTKALHTDGESHDDDHFPSSKLSSVSSTYSNPSVRSNGDFTSDDGHVTSSTRPSTPGSPRSVMSVSKLKLSALEGHPTTSSSTNAHHDSYVARGPPAPEQEAAVEATLGRKRCIMFACGKNPTTNATKEQPSVLDRKVEPVLEPKRACTIKFACPFKAGKGKDEEQSKKAASRRVSPAPPTKGSVAFNKRHRDSDSTVMTESPTTPKASTSTNYPVRRMRRLSQVADLGRTDACKFHEFASEEDESEEWTQESTCHKTPLTVNDTLKKENEIRRLAEEADEEEALDEVNGRGSIEDDEDDDFDSDDDDDVSDTGFQTDDEEGFAESDDDDNDSDSDYEWWAPRKTRAHSPYVGHDVFRPVAPGRTMSSSSAESDDGVLSTISRPRRGRHGQKRTRPVQIRPGTPDLPDSTDFVCGTLDEDRPMEEAYASCLERRRAAKHRAVPQDIDPSFPLSDPEIGSDDEDDMAHVDAADAAEESEHFMHAHLDSVDEQKDEEPRGRRLVCDTVKRSPQPSPKRLHSPPPPMLKNKACGKHRSPAPILLFNRSSPRRMRSPPPPVRLTSPPPSRRGSNTASPANGLSLTIPFLGTRVGEITHTASLPRSPHPFARRRQPSPPIMAGFDDEEDEGSATDRPTEKSRYARGAIDITQGLERKRLKRREKFHQKYLRKEEKKERKGRRPCPGKGAQRMRQVGLECAVYKGKRMLSI